MLELIAVGAACAVASAAGTVVLMRLNLAKDRAELAAVEAEQDYRDAQQDARYDEQVEVANGLITEADRLAQWDAYFRSLHASQPDTNGSTVDEEDIEVPVNRGRFSFDPTAAERVPTVALPEPGEVLREEQNILFAETRALGDYADSVAESALFGTEPFRSEAIDEELRDIMLRSRWGLMTPGELVEALTADRVGMPTGQYPIRTYPDDDGMVPQPGPSPHTMTSPNTPGDGQTNPGGGNPPKPYVPTLTGQPRVLPAVLHGIHKAAEKVAV